MRHGARSGDPGPFTAELLPQPQRERIAQTRDVPLLARWITAALALEGGPFTLG